MTFRNRKEAGESLAIALQRFRGKDVVVLGLPRGGVPVAAIVARRLSAPLDVILVRKLGVPFQPELAMGAIGEGGTRIINDDVVRSLGVTSAQFARVEARERAELVRRAETLRPTSARPHVAGRTVIIVDDGIATGSTAWAACEVARAMGAAWIVLAAPVGAGASVAELRAVADEVVCLETPEPFRAVGEWYEDFSATTDAEVMELLRSGFSDHGETEVAITDGTARLSGSLRVPERARGMVLFAHGSGSSRNSPRNRWVADLLDRAGFATLLFDLLTPVEERARANVFDIDLLGRRLAVATRWVASQTPLRELPIGYFGASTGAAAALWAAAEPDLDVRAVVSRGGRPDLAVSRMGAVTAPTLLIVGSEDARVLELNRHVLRYLPADSHLSVVPGATHLFEEPGTLRTAAQLAQAWFERHLAESDSPAQSRSG